MTSRLNVKALVFDLDGTLVDSRRDLASSANELLRDCGGQGLDEEAVGRMVGEGAAVLVHRVFSAAGIPEPPDALARFLDIYRRRLLETTRPYDGVPELLSALEGRALHVLTNKPRAMAETVLAGLALRRFFGEVYGGDGPYPRKPDADGLRALAREAEAPLDATVMVGDSVIDLRTARAAGARVCLVRYGFGFAAIPGGELLGDEWIVNAPLELALRVAG
jgi:phosphoglycolate phosphatase